MADNELTSPASTFQYLRACRLLVVDGKNNALDLSELHIKFSVKHSDNMTPNVADIRVYNLAEETALKIRKEFKQVVLEAGYQGNYGVIFQGNIKQVILGRESATDTFIDIVAGDGENAYNFSVINSTIAKGATSTDQVQAASTSLATKGVSQGYINNPNTQALPRGKVMFGNARDYLRSIAQATGQNWSIQNGKLNYIPRKSYLPGEALKLTSKTGMIGTPQQTNEGVNIKCLLNPRIKTSGRIWIDNKSIALYKINFSVPGSPANIPPPINADGVYFVLIV